MAATLTRPDSTSSTDRKTGFCSNTKIYHSSRPDVILPPENLPLSAAEYAFSIFQKNSVSPENAIALIANGTRLTYSDFFSRSEALATCLQTRFQFNKGDTAFILSPTSLELPILYFSLLSLGVIVSPANWMNTIPEISRQVSLTKPVMAFATSATASKLPSLLHGMILLDSNEFQSMMTIQPEEKFDRAKLQVNQSDTAAIIYSSGTTGPVKGVELTHRNFIAVVAGFDQNKAVSVPIILFTVPLFYVVGFNMCLRVISKGETVVLMDKFDFVGMLEAIQTYRVNFMPVSPPLVAAMANLEVVDKFDLSSLVAVGCGGSPLGKDVSEKFVAQLPHVQIVQGYGMTETTGGATRTLGYDEITKHDFVGRLSESFKAKIVEPSTGEALPPGKKGELWLRGPFIMRGYIGDDEATSSTLDPDGWLKTGDLFHVDSDGFFYIGYRLKDLIKYKA